MRAIILGIALVWAAPAHAIDDYESCAALVSADPELAVVEAERWERFGGGAPAGHCRALALIALGSDLVAAQVLFDVVTYYPETEPAAQSELLAQVGRIYLDRGLYEQADYALSVAAQAAPGTAELLRTRAALRLAQGVPAAAAADLDQLISTYPAEAEDVVQRAVARRQMGDFAGARADAIRAGEMDPGNPRAWLELGAAEEGLGNKDAARAAWLTAIDRDPQRAEGAIGRAAQLSLQRMDLGAD